MKRFPVLKQGTHKTMPRSVPWEFVEKFRAQAEENHDQTRRAENRDHDKEN